MGILGTVLGSWYAEWRGRLFPSVCELHRIVGFISGHGAKECV